MISETTTIFLNGQWLEAHAANAQYYQPNLHAGNGVFELIRAYGTESGAQILQSQAHFQRLHQSAKKTHLQLGYSVEELSQIATQLLQRNRLTDAYIRAVVFLDPQEEELPAAGNAKLMLTAWPVRTLTRYHELRVMTSSYRLPHPENRMPATKEIGQHAHTLIATNEARQNGYDDGLLLTSNGHIAGGPSANFFFEQDDTLYTAPKGHIFPGITRAVIMELAREIGYTVVERHFGPEEVHGADAAFFTSTSHEIQGIGMLDGKAFSKDWEDSMGFNLLLRYRKAAREQALPMSII